jgi:hypothetical protein
MQREPHEIAHVSDTALMTAACRAMETERPDGLIRDPFAESLAGARGMAIANNLPGLERMRFGVCLRSRFLDELLLDTGESTSIQRSDAGSSSRQGQPRPSARERWGMLHQLASRPKAGHAFAPVPKWCVRPIIGRLRGVLV